MSRPAAPTVAGIGTGHDGRWSLVEEREDVRLDTPTMRVLANTRVYADETLRERVREATGVDHTWRFFFATALGFEPPLPPFTGTASVYGTVRSEAREAFVADLRDRGVDRVERGRTERMRTETGDRVSLTRYRGRTRVDTGEGSDPVAVPIAGLLGVWTHDGTFRLAGGGYPDVSLATALTGAPGTDPNAFRNELVDLVRGTR
jgi:hypothetical protein